MVLSFVVGLIVGLMVGGSGAFVVLALLNSQDREND